MHTRTLLAVVGLLFVAFVALGLQWKNLAQAADAPTASSPNTRAASESDATPGGSQAMINVCLYDPNGKLQGPTAVPRVERSDAEWKKELAPEVYNVTRQAGTERAFTGALLNEHREGVFTCADCGLPLFASGAKFDSGTGWPSFFRPIAKENVATRSDTSLGMVRTEVECPRCGAHLGHVFDDGPAPTGLRYCMNSASLKFVPEADLASLADKPALAGMMAQTAATAEEGHGMGNPGDLPATADVVTSDGLARAVFAGGCFWCVEGVFEQIEGVDKVISGYSGGEKATANYEAVCTGTTGHAESVEILYDPKKVSYEKLLKIHFATHDPTTLNQQGADRGTQYRSAIFYANEAQKEAAAQYIRLLEAEKAYGGRKIVTTLEPLQAFYEAETYHQDFAAKNPFQPYIRSVAMPKIEKTREKFSDLLKPSTQLKP